MRVEQKTGEMIEKVIYARTCDVCQKEIVYGSLEVVVFGDHLHQEAETCLECAGEMVKRIIEKRKKQMEYEKECGF